MVTLSSGITFTNLDSDGSCARAELLSIFLSWILNGINQITESLRFGGFVPALVTTLNQLPERLLRLYCTVGLVVETKSETP